MESDYQLIRSRKRKKTLSLKITEKGTVVIQAPYHTPAGEVAAFFERKKAWVQEKNPGFCNNILPLYLPILLRRENGCFF